ncbi:unnamed protein product, partial [Meganyctiphanes norvegica]
MSSGCSPRVGTLTDRDVQRGVYSSMPMSHTLTSPADVRLLHASEAWHAFLDSWNQRGGLPQQRLVRFSGVVTLNGQGVVVDFLIDFNLGVIIFLIGSKAPRALFFIKAKALPHDLGQLEIDSTTAFKLAALALQATHGHFTHESSTHSQLKKSQLIPQSVIKEHPSLQYCEQRVAEEHRLLQGQTRGEAIVQYMTVVERLPTYGVHYYEVRDRSNLPWYLGISHRGIAQYDYLDKRKPRRVFLWKQLENLYFRERKFSIEVHDPKRVVHTLSSFNLYEDAIEDARENHDDLLDAITEATTQVSVSRRTFGPGNVSVYIWFAETQALCKSIWSMAIAQHQFYLDRKTSRHEVSGGMRELPELAVELSRSCVSLSTHSSSSNLSRSGSHSSLVNNSQAEDSASTESLHQARMEMYNALKERRDAIQEKLKDKNEELKLLCLREGQLTGELPPEYPQTPGEPPPTVRKRVGTSFTLSENLINKIINKQEETIAALELEYEIQSNITSASLKLANESMHSKGVRKQRKVSFKQSAQRLKQLEEKLKSARSKQQQTANGMPKQKKKPRPISDGEGVGVYDENTNPNTTTTSVSQESPRDPLGIDGVSLSPNPATAGLVSGVNRSSAAMSPLTPVRARARRDLSPGANTVATATSSPHSAPASPHKTPNGTLSSRPTSPSRPNSGYIPSNAAYARSQYRVQQYPTLSTRSHSVPADENRVPHQRSNSSSGTPISYTEATGETPGGLYNIPQQRTSLACHSLDDLDAPPLSATITTTPSIASPANHIHYQQNNQPVHHHHLHHHQPFRPRNDSQDRYGSLDRRRPSSGRPESRSCEHLDQALPPHHHHFASPHLLHPPHASPPSASPASSPYTPHHHIHYQQFQSPGGPSDLQQFQSPTGGVHQTHEAMDTTLESHTSGDTVSSDRSSQDVVDAATPGTIIQHRATHRYRSQSSACLPPQSAFHSRNNNNGLSHASTLRGTQNGPIHRLVRTSSGRSYMETTFDGAAPNHNQENIPPLRPTSEVVLPLRPTNGVHYDTSHPPLRPTSSVNSRDILPLRSSSSLDLPPLRATKSSSELPPLRPTSLKTSDSSLSSHNTSLCSMQEESLISLAEAARPRKHSIHQHSQQIGQQREWYETSLDSPTPNRKSKKSSSSMMEMNDSVTSDGSTIPANQTNSTLNISGSSVGSTGSSNGSVFPSNTEADSSHSSLSFVESPRNHMVISTGSYQPSRESSKPFEMSDFYKYSTKYRRQSSGTGNCSSGTSGYQSSVSSSSGDTPLSPVLPPRGAGVARLMPPSPTLVAQQSAPAPQQKGVYQPLSPMSCQPLSLVGSPAHGEPQEPVGAWDASPLHQAVPATVTHKRSATLVK